MSISRRDKEVRMVVCGAGVGVWRREEGCGDRSWFLLFGVEDGRRLREERLVVSSGSREA